MVLYHLFSELSDQLYGCFLRIWRMAMVTGYGVSAVVPGYGVLRFQHPHYLAAVFVKHILPCDRPWYCDYSSIYYRYFVKFVIGYGIAVFR